jgi:two-component sensor histidine kinase
VPICVIKYRAWGSFFTLNYHNTKIFPIFTFKNKGITNIPIVLANENTEGPTPPLLMQPMKKIIYQLNSIPIYRGGKLLCLLASFLLLTPSAFCQDFSFLPDSIKRALATLPESVHDSIYESVGASAYKKYTDEGFSQALDCFKNALALAEKYGHTDMIPDLTHSIGNVYDSNNDNPQQVLFYYKKTLDLVAKLEGNIRIGCTYDVAHAYNQLHDSTQSMYYLQQMNRLKTEVCGDDKNPELWDKVSLLEAYLTMKNNNIKDFVTLFGKVNQNRVYQNTRFPYARYFAICSWRYAFEKGDYPKAVESITAELQKNATDSSLLMGYLAKAYAKNGNFKEAYIWEACLNDYDSRNTKATHQKDLVVKLLKTDNDFLALEKSVKEKQSQYLLLGFILSLLAAGATTYFWYANYKSKIELAKRNEEKAILVHEIHHRVKNNLQLLYGLTKLQLPTITDENARDLWQKNMSQLKAMSLVNEKLYNTEGVTSVVLQDFITEILGHFRQIQGVKEEVGITTNIDNKLTVSADFAVPFGLILSELITNSYKYALNEGVSTIMIDVSKKDKNILFFNYSDSGKLADMKLILNKKTGGSALIRDLVRQLKGSLNISNENNLQYNFSLPI